MVNRKKNKLNLSQIENNPRYQRNNKYQLKNEGWSIIKVTEGKKGQDTDAHDFPIAI